MGVNGRGAGEPPKGGAVGSEGVDPLGKTSSMNSIWISSKSGSLQDSSNFRLGGKFFDNPVNPPMDVNLFNILNDVCEDGEIIPLNEVRGVSCVSLGGIGGVKGGGSPGGISSGGKEDWVEGGSSFGKRKLAKELQSLRPIKLSGIVEELGKGKLLYILKSVLRSMGFFLWVCWKVLSEGLFGGILVLWKSDLASFSILESSHQLVIGELYILNKVVGGYFNCLVSKEDKRGGKKFCFSQGPKEMKSFLVRMDLHEVDCIGPKFTWCNKKFGSPRILERLDRCFLNSSTLNSSRHLVVRHLSRVASDHCPIILDLSNHSTMYRYNIKFEDVWASYPTLVAVVQKDCSKRASGNFVKLRELTHLKDNLKQEVKEEESGGLSEEDIWALKATRRKKKIINRIMGFKQVNELCYLGVKVTLRRLVKSDFKFIVDKTLRKMNIWGSSVVVAVQPALILLPSSQNTIGAFFGVNRMEDSVFITLTGMSCIERLCRDDVDFIFVQELSKLAWNFVQDKDSLMYKILIDKYGSATWKIISVGYKFLNPIIRWKNAVGESIDVYKDVWILDKCINMWPTFVVNQTVDVLIVDKFIVDGCWNFAELWMEDQLELIQQNLGKPITALSFGASVQEQSDCVYLSWIEKAKLNSRVEVFWWRMFHMAIPTFQFLAHRRLQNITSCPRGCNVVEDQVHVAIKCLKLNEVFKCFNKLGFCIPSFDSFEDCCLWLKSSILKNGVLVNLYCSSIFLSWKERNKMVHKSIVQTLVVIAAKVMLQFPFLMEN
ncbi:hypothetical protein M5K25_020975 [Dendrobium thyrsiflorum]|uniref:Reverse transcriptase zinc-binding domain-containing protein n=1 Tax=Dendrobium thyrsiflorum TaxID=117978 RepID=A0ABD0UI90_DENTH